MAERATPVLGATGTAATLYFAHVTASEVLALYTGLCTAIIVTPRMIRTLRETDWKKILLRWKK